MAEGFEFYEVLPKFIDKAKNYLTMAKKKDNPFFLYLPLAAPHTPWVPKSYYNGVSNAGQYGEFVTMVDDLIGDLLEHLKNLGLEEDTIVVFASDNGPYWKQPYVNEFNHRAAGELRGMKGDIYDGGHRIPHIVRWPGKINAGSKNHIPNTLASFYSTIADLLNLDSTAIDSYSIFSQLINESKKEIYQPIVHHSSEGHFSIRNGDWKMIEKLGSGGFSLPKIIDSMPGVRQERLYNMREDLSEQINLADDYPKIIAGMKYKLDSIRSISIN
jgi:arylsulfatase A-like enzyme